jgi:hypothetical protein
LENLENVKKLRHIFNRIAVTDIAMPPIANLHLSPSNNKSGDKLSLKIYHNYCQEMENSHLMIIVIDKNNYLSIK